MNLGAAVASGPVASATRVFLSLSSGQVTAHEAGAGREIWRQSRVVTAPMAFDDRLLFLVTGDGVEALRQEDGASAWIVRRIAPVAPLLAIDGWVIAVTEAEVLGIRSADGEVIWRRDAGGVRLTPAVAGDRLFVGANDGRVAALQLADGSVAWDTFVPGGVTAIAASDGRVYVGAGDKRLYCLDANAGKPKWNYRIGAIVTGHIAVGPDRVYVASLDNVVRALDRESGNQRWQQGLRQRPAAGPILAGHVVFLPVASTEMVLLYDHDGRRSGLLTLPGTTLPELPAAIQEIPGGLAVFVATGGLTNEWSLTKYGPAGDTTLVPFEEFTPLPGPPFLTDPELQPTGRVLGLLLLGDPPTQPFSELGWPVVLRDPPLEPLTTLPGLQLRPLSPALPVRRGGLSPVG